MSSLQLRTFTPPETGANGAGGATRRKLEEVRETAYQEGFLAGQSSALEAQLEDEARISSHLVEAINDAGLTNEAARRHVAASLAPMISALFRAVTPALADRGLAAEIARLVDQALDNAPEGRPRVRCAPEVAERMAALFAERAVEATLEPAQELLPREAEVHWDQGFDRLDLDACIAEIEAAIGKHVMLEEPTKEGGDHQDG